MKFEITDINYINNKKELSNIKQSNNNIRGGKGINCLGGLIKKESLETLLKINESND